MEAPRQQYESRIRTATAGRVGICAVIWQLFRPII